jgi:hypothetical protein
LIERLNQDGSHWGKPHPPEGREAGIDCETTDGTSRLNIQVTRSADIRLWRNLGKVGSAVEGVTIEEIADQLRAAIAHKESVPPSNRGNILLAFNALDTPGHAVGAAVDLFRRRYGAEVAALGFSAIWVVGPTVSLMMRLDCLDPVP